jgi:hypothetical protein
MASLDVVSFFIASFDMASLDIESLLMVSAAKTLAAPTARHMDRTTVVNFFMMKLLDAGCVDEGEMADSRQLPPNQL